MTRWKEEHQCFNCVAPGTNIDGWIVCDSRECEQVIADSLEEQRETDHAAIDAEYGYERY